VPRILAIIGSGETAPPLVGLHRELLARLRAESPAPLAARAIVRAVLIDTPYGFQDNADDISAKTVEYFSRTVGNPIEIAALRAPGADALTRAAVAARIAEARYVFSGPGSPSYALRAWTGTEIPGLIAGKLRDGSIVAFASAAALTLGAFTAPIYEIYKVGEDPRWLPGFDLLSAAAGLRVAVIPHYDNAEGGNHDTRFCYLGERRLAEMEALLPDDAFILGVDSHTALLLDMAAETAKVWGRGTVTVRWRGSSTVFPSGASVPIETLRAAGRPKKPRSTKARTQPTDSTGRTDDRAPGANRARAGEASQVPPPPRPTSLLDSVAQIQRKATMALETRDGRAAAGALLALEEAIATWAMDTGSAEAIGEARAVQRSLIARLGALADSGPQISRTTVGPFIDALLHVRLSARAGGDWATGDAIRDRLVAAGVEVRDGPDGTTWELASDVSQVSSVAPSAAAFDTIGRPGPGTGAKKDDRRS
jgi:hypothetical protein